MAGGAIEMPSMECDEKDDEQESVQPTSYGTGDMGDCDGIWNAKRGRFVDPGSPIQLDLTKLRPSDDSNYPVNSQNRFSILGDLEIEADFNNSNNNSSNINNNSNINSRNNGRNSGRLARKQFCTPIILYNVNVKHLVDQLEARATKIDFKIKNINRRKSKLFFSDLNVYKEMMALLKEKKINSYSFTPKELRQLSFVIRGLYYKTEIDDIENALNAIVPNVVSKVSKFETSYSKKNNTETGLFLVTLQPDKGLKGITHIKYILNQSFVWEKPKRNEREIQCRRC